MGAVSDVVSSVGDVIGGALDTVGNVIDKAVSNPLETAAIIATAVVAPEFLPALGESAAAAEGLTAAEGLAAAEGATGLATLGESVLPATEAFATGSELAALPEAASGFGISTAAPAAEFGTFNPATTSGIGIDSTALNTQPWLGGSTTLPAGTAGMTAEQIAASGTIGGVGSNASSGLGYLGGSESLPNGTAGITGVTDTPIWDTIKNTVSDVGSNLGQSLTGGNTAYLLAKGLTGGQQSSPIGYNMNKNPFVYPQQQPLQGGITTSTVPPELQNQNVLASLLRK